MTAFFILLGDWGYALAAAMFTVLAILSSRRPQQVGGRATLPVALALTALWALSAMFGRSVAGMEGLSGGAPETARNAAWLALLWPMLRQTHDRGPQRLPRAVRAIFGALMLALACQFCLDLVAGPGASLSLLQAGWLLRAVTALGAIVLLHGLFARLGHDSGTGIGWLGAALTVMWAYEFNHYALAWLSDGRVLAVGQMRGLVMAAIAPLILLGTGGRERGRIALSRPAAYRTATAAFGLLYAIALLAMIAAIRALDDPLSHIVPLGLVFGLSVLALMLLPSAPFRAWLRVEIAKHLFAHRYDYREEWMRFAEALGDEGRDGALPPHRAARAVANAVSAPAALLLLRNDEGALAPEAEWNWPGLLDPAHLVAPDRVAALQASGWTDAAAPDDAALAPVLPEWILRVDTGWAIVPLLHHGALIGAVLLARPPGRGALDWEDLDMLRVVARQLAVTISEQRQQRALAEAQRFEEFNRRFAFILHDIKNMVSQMSLLAANAERHAEKPAFRADMVLTLKETAGRMNELIARLARTDGARPADGAVCDLAEVVRGVARGRALVSGEAALPVTGDAGAIEQAVAHLLQNAIDATPPGGAPVRLALAREGDRALLDIIDEGVGMSPTFLRDGLFRPFASTKPGGFGLGAHEARALVTAMGGRLTVASREGAGTRFTLSLPLAEAMPARKAG